MKKAKLFNLYFTTDTPSYKRNGSYSVTVVAKTLTDAIKTADASLDDIYSVNSSDVIVSENI